ncbi:MAG: hypothetical protein NT177_06915 [Chloroflexi bacterium]|nr:hypothetical protein [Chloroflexota bacterium]
MLKIELVPDLLHCIHTVTKREYEDTLRRLLSEENGNKKLGKKLELLTIMLKEMDFKQLRRESEKYIREGKQVKFVFYLKNNVPEYETQVF